MALFAHALAWLTARSEEFAIYMNYVRKLEFEETPDYDFLRDLFTKILKSLGEPDDGIFDWMLVKGWESSAVCVFRVSLFVVLIALTNTGKQCPSTSRAAP